MTAPVPWRSVRPRSNLPARAPANLRSQLGPIKKGEVVVAKPQQLAKLSWGSEELYISESYAIHPQYFLLISHLLKVRL